jgi:hypothetical protein
MQPSADWLSAGAHRVYDFFHTAHIRTEVTLDLRLLLKATEAGSLRGIAAPWTPQWEKFVSQVAWDHARREFAMAIESHAQLDPDLKVIPSPSDNAFTIISGQVQLAIIHATRASVRDHPPIYGNFLTPGSHWTRLAQAISNPEINDTNQGTPTAGSRLIDRLPADLPQQVISACLEASRRIRLERQVAYEHPLILEFATSKLTLQPIAGRPPQLHVPFSLRTRTMPVSGELLLRNQDPLPVLIRDNVGIEDATTAWIYALLGFAEATCIEFQPTAPRSMPIQPHGPQASSVPRQRASTRTLPIRHPWPGQLEPIGPWIRHGASFVAGHRRHLRNEQTASDEAVERAYQVGITLNPHETWVRPHTRGIPDNAEMRFRWHMPAELKHFTRSKLVR